MRSPLKNLDTIQIIGFVISALVSIGLLVTGQDGVASVTLGFVLAALIQLFDLQKRHSDSEERLLKANALSQALYRNEWLLEHIQQIVSDYTSVKEVWFDLFKRRADDVVIECRTVIHGMAEGYLTVQNPGPYASGGDALLTVKKSAKAVAAIDNEYWHSPDAEAYVQATADAIRRGVKFVRVFTYPLTILRGMVDILEHHRNMGIEVYIASTERLPRELNQDYIIIDDSVIIRTEQIGQLQRISINKVEVEQNINQWC